ncbi:MAG TPA: hypothetical protein VME69_10135 [Methylocella sp.]|nr:hypothetical protein [Methylocella sp.]
MPISASDLAEIDAVLSSGETGAQPFAALRQKFPHLAWTRCDASDVTEAPFRVYPQYDIHLLDSHDHCAHITTDPEHATGIILAKRSAVR